MNPPAQPPIYDRIGAGYAATRRPDPRIAQAVLEALSDARSVVNVGAGAGSYEPSDRPVVAVEPSSAMIAQRAAGAAPAVRATAERLPFRQQTFDAALAVLTVHHWPDRDAGLRELRRVARRRAVILTWDPAFADAFWLVTQYLPEVAQRDIPRFPPIDHLAGLLGGATARPVPIPHDCLDGFLGACWRRPEAYLDPGVRAGVSTLALLDDALVRSRMGRLADDLRSGAWDRRNGRLRGLDAIDLGYRLVVAEFGGSLAG